MHPRAGSRLGGEQSRSRATETSTSGVDCGSTLLAATDEEAVSSRAARACASPVAPGLGLKALALSAATPVPGCGETASLTRQANNRTNAAPLTMEAATHKGRWHYTDMNTTR